MRAHVKDLKPGDTFDFVPGSWHGPSTVLVNERSGPDPTGSRFGHPLGGLRHLKFSNTRVINPPGVSYVRDLQEVEVID